MKDLILKIHGSGKKIVLAITGGGAEAIGELLRHGQGSNTLLEAVVPYNQKAFDDFVRGTPDKYCSPGAARDLAMAAFQRGINLAGTHENIIGIGASSSLVKDDEREGREHHAYIGVQTADMTSTYILKLDGLGYTREEEEFLVGKAIIDIIADNCKLANYPPTSFANGIFLDNIVLGKNPIFTVGVNGRGQSNIVFPGAFNPFHDQHGKMAEKVAEIKGEKVDLELCVRNVDKPALNYEEIQYRLQQLKRLQKESWMGNIHITGTPTFAAKAAAFIPNTTFLVGWDTFVRLSNPKYGDLEAAMQVFRNRGTKFIVFHRISNGKSSLDEGLNMIYPPMLEISEFPDLPPVELASSELRKRNPK